MSYHSLNRWKQILNDHALSNEVADKIEDIIEALEYIEGWEPAAD